MTDLGVIEKYEDT